MLRQATASLRSGHYLKMEKAEVSHERNPVMGMYPAKNGRWSYIHANFPNHRAAALKVLGVPEDKEAVRAGGRQMGRARTRGGDHRRQGRRRHGAQHGRMGASTRRPQRDRLAAAVGDRQDRRRAGRETAATATGRCPASACST